MMQIYFNSPQGYYSQRTNKLYYYMLIDDDDKTFIISESLHKMHTDNPVIVDSVDGEPPQPGINGIHFYQMRNYETESGGMWYTNEQIAHSRRVTYMKPTENYIAKPEFVEIVLMFIDSQLEAKKITQQLKVMGIEFNTKFTITQLHGGGYVVDIEGKRMRISKFFEMLIDALGNQIVTKVE